MQCPSCLILMFFELGHCGRAAILVLMENGTLPLRIRSRWNQKYKLLLSITFLITTSTVVLVLLSRLVNPPLASPAALLKWKESSPWQTNYGSTSASIELTTGYSNFSRKNVAIISFYVYHFDVYLAVAKTFKDVMGNDSEVQVYAHTPLYFGFSAIVQQLNLYDGEYHHPDQLIVDMQSTDTSFDIIVVGTCEVDMKNLSDKLLIIWDERPAEKKFTIVCIVHYLKDTEWQSHIAPWARRGAIRLLPIAHHVSRAFDKRFKELADSTEPDAFTSMYEYIKIGVHVPVLPLPDYFPTQHEAPDGRLLSRAVIQGSIETVRRDYPRILQELEDSLKMDAKSWGYLPLSTDRTLFLPDPQVGLESFSLHLVGKGSIEIPESLKHVVFVYNDLDYLGYYTIMQSMDIAVPAFNHEDYYDLVASSTIAMAVECNVRGFLCVSLQPSKVPILATDRIRKSYGYIDDDRVVITRPQALREVAAIHLLRTRRIPISETFRLSSRYEADIKAMLRKGWHRSREGFETVKREIWHANREHVLRILTTT